MQKGETVRIQSDACPTAGEREDFGNWFCWNSWGTLESGIPRIKDRDSLLAKLGRVRAATGTAGREASRIYRKQALKKHIRET